MTSTFWRVEAKKRGDTFSTLAVVTEDREAKRRWRELRDDDRFLWVRVIECPPGSEPRTVAEWKA